MTERLGSQIELMPIEVAKIPTDFDWHKEAWFSGQLHPIRRLENERIWVPKTVKDKGYRYCVPRLGFEYQITPFIFLDEVAVEATGAHLVIPENCFSNRVLIADPNFRVRTRIVSGAGWLKSESPLREPFQQWVGADVDSGKIFEFSQYWIYQIFSPVGYSSLIMELVEIPEYTPGCEVVIE